MQRMNTAAVAIVVAVALLPALAPAQVPQQTTPIGQPAPAATPQPQAGSPEELEAFQKMNDSSLTGDQLIVLADEFLQKFPDSELKAYAYRRTMEGYRLKNDYPKMLEFGEKSIAENKAFGESKGLAGYPEDPVVLLLLALAIPERTRETDLDRDQKLNKAEDYAKRALAAIDKMPKPNPQITDTDWDRMRNDARGQSHAALGYVAMQRKQYAAGADFLKKSIELQTEKDPIVHWRLGLAYRLMQQYEPARTALKEAVALGGVKVGDRDYAADELERVEALLKKQ